MTAGMAEKRMKPSEEYVSQNARILDERKKRTSQSCHLAVIAAARDSWRLQLLLLELYHDLSACDRREGTPVRRRQTEQTRQHPQCWRLQLTRNRINSSETTLSKQACHTQPAFQDDSLWFRKACIWYVFIYFTRDKTLVVPD